MDETAPQHNNNGKNNYYCNRIVYWNATDSKSQWEKNQQNPEHAEYFEQQRWITEHAIEYRYNSHGFRDTEFDSTPCYIALGCSHTQGVGLSSRDTWVTLLQNMMGVKVWNLGVSSSSLDTCFRLLDYYINHLEVKGVFVLEPEPSRFELFEGTSVVPYTAQHQFTPQLYKYWISNKNNMLVNVKKNLAAMKFTCIDHEAKFYSMPCTSIDHVDKARDLMHAGPASNHLIAEKFYKNV